MRITFEGRDICRSFVIGSVIGMCGGLIIAGWGPFMWLCFGTCGSAAAMLRILVKLNSDSGICEHHFRKVC